MGERTIQTAPGADLLDDFIKRNGFTDGSAAHALGVSRPTVISWRTGFKRPVADHRTAIERWSRFEVPADSWALPDEVAALKSVAPFTPSES